VQWAYYALVCYHPHPTHESPLFPYTLSFRRRDYIHCKQVAGVRRGKENM